MSNRISERRKEFSDYVWNHSADEFQATFDERRGLNAAEIKLLTSIVQQFDAGADDKTIAGEIQHLLSQNSSKKHIEVLLQLCGMTRSKILQDLKAASSGRRGELRLSNHLGLAAHAKTWEIAGPYLVAKLRKVLHHPPSSAPEIRLLQALNQATWPGYIRQERAKRSGHEAEYRIATLLFKVGIPFVPEEKADNPLCRDAIWNDVSFDVVVPNLVRPAVCIKSTVHTSNIGQYGESKDHLEIDEARRMIDELPAKDRPLLVAFIDGVGFESNTAGLHGVLDKADEFCQFNTIWKLVVIAASKTERHCRLYLTPDDRARHQEFLKRYRRSLTLEYSPFTGAIEAGYGLVHLSS